MQTGHFFKLDKNSFLHKGEVVFRYLRVVSNKEQPLYPMYISIKSNCIDFYFHGYLYNKKLKRNEFIETELFSLPLSTHETVVNELNSTLEEVFDSQFPFLFNYSLKKTDEETKDSKEIKKTADSNCLESEDRKIPANTQSNDVIKNNQDKETADSNCFELEDSEILAYTNLKDFKINDQDVDKAKSEKGKKHMGKKLLVRQLLLDFIFDIQHSTVFHACPYFNNAHQLLKENLFFEAISTKANFYYWLNKSEEHKKQKKQLDLFILSENELKKAKKRWIEIIQKPNADKVIKKKNKSYWFKDIETELLNTYIRSERILDKSKLLSKLNRNSKFNFIQKLSRKERIDSSFWLIDRYNIIGALKLSAGWLGIALSIIAFILTFNYTNFGTSDLIYKLINIDVLFFSFFGVFSFIALIRLEFSFPAFFKLIILNLILIISSAWLFVFDIDTLRNYLFEKSITDVWLIAIFVLLFSFSFIFSIDKEERPNASLMSVMIKTFIILLISFFYSFTINLIATTSFANEKMPQEYFLEKIWNETDLLSIPDSTKVNDSTSILINRKKFIMNNAKRMWIDRTKNNKEYKQVLFVLDDIKIAGLGGDSLFTTGNNKINLIKKNNKKRYKDDVLYTNLQNLNLPETEQKVMYKVEFLWWNFDIFPSMLLINTVLALFVGIFIQLIINRKKLTEN